MFICSFSIITGAVYREGGRTENDETELIRLLARLYSTGGKERSNSSVK